MKTPLLALAVALLASACGPAPADAPADVERSTIIGGTADATHPAVVSIINTATMNGCSGTLIDPTTVLTAAHCTEDTDPTHYEVVGGASISAYSWLAHARLVARDARYIVGQPTSGYDIGVVILDPVGLVNMPAPLAWLSVVDATRYAPGTAFVEVGYGWSTGTVNDYGTRRIGSFTVATSTTDRFTFGSAATGICLGDSGGPAIETINGVEMVVGVASYVGDAACSTFSADMRTDVEAGFITPYIGLVTPTPVPPTPTPTPSVTPTSTPSPTPTPVATPKKHTGGCEVSL